MRNLIFTLIVLICITTINLFWTIFFFETSPIYYFSNLPNTFTYLDNNISISEQHINVWAVRGQIGDILAGHFSALAFFAIGISIYLQSEANKKIQEGISLQAKEFLVHNTNLKNERYYKILDKQLEIVDEECIKEYQILNNNLTQDPTSLKLKDDISKNENKIIRILSTLEFMYSEIIIPLQEKDSSLYQEYYRDLQNRMITNATIYSIFVEYSLAKKFTVYKLIKEIRETNKSL